VKIDDMLVRPPAKDINENINDNNTIEGMKIRICLP
jgi:hypothetical protein